MPTKPDTARIGRYVPRMLLGWLASAAGDPVELLEGTMVFADVSGFTRLSERLARQGKEGAEYLVDAINACFSALLYEAYSRGGSLLKFGGDAMLLWFSGEDHPARACSSAVAMRRTLREVGRIRAGSTTVVLRMSVGVHSGAYAMFLVGDSHQELLIGGPEASVVVAMEGLASAGQILVSPATASLLPRTCLGANVGNGVVLTRAPSESPWAAPTESPEPSQEAIGRCLSTTVRAHLVGGHVTPEHRTAVIAFLQFRGLDRMIAEDGIQRAARSVDALVRVVQDATARYEVSFLDSDISADGGKIRLSAGAPRTVGDDEERMLLALREIIDAGVPLAIQAGVHRGPVFTGEVGPAYRRWYAVMGDTVNLAARVMAKAPAGHIYATGAVLQGAKTSFEQIALEPFAVKGKSRPVQAWDAGPPVRGTSGVLTVRLESPLVGRERELAQLRAAIGASRRGSGMLIELVGEAGSGKSRLVAEARELVEGLVVRHATCKVYTRDTPYSVWRNLLRQLLELGPDESEPVVRARLESEIERSQPDLRPWMSLIAIVLDIDVQPTREVEQLAAQSRAAKLHEVVLRFLSRALVVPTIVEIEQAHLMDAASVALFNALARELETSSWLVLVTRREAPGGLVLPDRAHTRIELGPLSREDTTTLALSTFEAAQLPPHVVELAIERSGGSPQFLLDLLAAAVAGNRDQLPESVGAATMARIDALDPADGAIVRRAAVLGPSFDARQLVDVTAPDMPVPDDRFWARLSTVFERDDTGQVRFRRPALQEAAYASLPFKLRRELHRAVGLSLEQDHERELDADPAVLSRHFAAARDHARAYRYAISAATRATERFAHVDAARLYRRAIDTGRAAGHAADAGELAYAWEQLGEALRSAGEPAAAARAFTQARRLLREDPIAQARLCDRHANVAIRSEALSAAVRWLNRGFRWLDSLQDVEACSWRARMRSNLGGIRNRQGRWAQAISTCRQAIAEAEPVGELSALARACYELDWALVESGRRDEASYSWRALEIYEQLGNPEREFMVLNNLGGFAYFDGAWDEAIALYRRAGASAARAGRPADAAYTDCNVGEILSDQGRFDEAEAHLSRAHRIWSGTGERHAVAYVDVLMARLAVRGGDAGRTPPALQTAAAELRRVGMGAYAEFAQAVLAEAESIAGDASRALEIARRELESGNRQRPLLKRSAGWALARVGRGEAAQRELNEALVSARDRASDYDVAATIDALDRLGGADASALSERDEILARLRIVALPALRLS